MENSYILNAEDEDDESYRNEHERKVNDDFVLC